MEGRSDKKGSGHQASMDSIEEYLNCFICLGSIKSANMCPHCSKIGCHACMNKWLTKQRECPHCRKRLETAQLVKCRFVDEVQLHISKVKKARSVETCSIHSQTLSYYCRTCTQPVCPECVMFPSEPHHGHQILRVEEVFVQKSSAVEAEAKEARQRAAEMRDLIKGFDKQIDSLYKNKQRSLEQLKDFQLHIQETIEEQHSQKLAAIQAQQQGIRERAEALDKAVETFELALAEKIKCNFIANAETMIDALQKGKAASLNLNLQETPLEIESPTTPAFERFETFKITEFGQPASNVLFSNPLILDGQVWRLKVYPNGNRQAQNSHLSIYLELTEGFRQKAAKYQYSFELVHPEGKDRNCLRTDFSDFKKGDCWGYNKFISLSQIRDGFLRENTLEIRFSVKPANFRIKCEDQASWIEKMRGELQNDPNAPPKEYTETESLSNEAEPVASQSTKVEVEEPLRREQGESQSVKPDPTPAPPADPPLPRPAGEVQQAPQDELEDLPPLVEDSPDDVDQEIEGEEEEGEDEDEDEWEDEDEEDFGEEDEEDEEDEEEEEEEEEDRSEVNNIIRHLAREAVARLREITQEEGEGEEGDENEGGEVHLTENR